MCVGGEGTHPIAIGEPSSPKLDYFKPCSCLNRYQRGSIIHRLSSRWIMTLISDSIIGASLRGKSPFMDGVRASFGVPAFCSWLSCVAFAYFARDAGADWTKTMAAAVTNWSGSKLLLITIDEQIVSPLLVAATALILSLRLLPTATLISQHMEGGLWSKLLLSPTMTCRAWGAVDRGEALPANNRRAFFAGLCITFFVGNLVCTAVACFAPITLSPVAMMCMAMLLPLFYVLNLLGGAMSTSAIAMLAIAFVSEPLVARMAPNASVLITGLGSFALIAAFRKWRSAP